MHQFLSFADAGTFYWQSLIIVAGFLYIVEACRASWWNHWFF